MCVFGCWVGIGHDWMQLSIEDACTAIVYQSDKSVLVGALWCLIVLAHTVRHILFSKYVYILAIKILHKAVILNQHDSVSDRHHQIINKPTFHVKPFAHSTKIPLYKSSS